MTTLQLLNLSIGTVIKVLGISERCEEVDDVLVLIETPVIIGNEIIIYVTQPSGIATHITTPIELIDDIYLP